MEGHEIQNKLENKLVHYIGHFNYYIQINLLFFSHTVAFFFINNYCYVDLEWSRTKLFVMIRLVVEILFEAIDEQEYRRVLNVRIR